MINVVDRFLERREESAESTAIGGPHALTYGDLDRLSCRFAAMLLDQGCRPGDRVALLAPKIPLSIAAALAIYRTGCIYVPVDVDSPAVRASRILDVAECRVLIGHSSTLKRITESLAMLPALTRPKFVICSDKTTFDTNAPITSPVWMGLVDDPVASISPRTSSSGIAQLLFTSGSTGTPKGVMVTHANIMSFVKWANVHFGLVAGDRVSCHSPLSFDLSTWDIVGGLSAGAEIHLVDPRMNLSPKALITFIAERRLTQWFSVPTLLAFIAAFDALREGSFPELRRLIWCGEVIAPSVLTYWMRLLPNVEFTNLYGPTETTIASTFYTVPKNYAGDAVPIGYACGGEHVNVVDRNLALVESGQTGELLISGEGVTAGYWRDTKRTQRAFVAIDSSEGKPVMAYRTGDLGMIDQDGCLHFKGRSDSQVKCRGHRIELREIEIALLQLSGILDAVVVTYSGTGFSDVEIGCAVVTASTFDTSASELRSRLTNRLPKYMIPTRWLLLENMPTNANGKADRKLLSERIGAMTTATGRTEHGNHDG